MYFWAKVDLVRNNENVQTVTYMPILYHICKIKIIPTWKDQHFSRVRLIKHCKHLKQSRPHLVR